mgnify:CR=1 FL=1|tara:strand:+ start:216 stop:617 length:402 start_codon:yes stop_codon:yes gene_type:complete
MPKSWDVYYQKHEGRFDPGQILVIYLQDIEEEPDVLEELEENDYLECQSDSQSEAKLGEFCLGENVYFDELGEEFTRDATIIFHRIPEGFEESEVWLGGLESHKRFIFEWFNIAPEFVLEVGIDELSFYTYWA